MTSPAPAPAPAPSPRAKAPPEVTRLLRQEAGTIAALVSVGALSYAAGRRQMIRLALRLLELLP